MKPFLLVFHPVLSPRKSVLDFLDTRPEVLNWYGFLDSAIFIISRHTAYELARLFRERFPGVYVVVTQVHPGENDGWLPKDVWDFINNPRSSGRWPQAF